MKIVAVNRSASFEYFIEEKFEAVIGLGGSGGKSIRQNHSKTSDALRCGRRGGVHHQKMTIAVY